MVHNMEVHGRKKSGRPRGWKDCLKTDIKGKGIIGVF